MSNITNKQGFTLTELIVYIAISALVVTASLSMIWNIIQDQNKSKNTTLVNETGDLIMDRVGQYSKEAIKVSSETVFNSSTGKLVLNMNRKPNRVIEAYDTTVTIGGATKNTTKIRSRSTGGEESITEYCADNNVSENEDENDNDDDNDDDGNYSYSYNYDYSYEKGNYRYSYEYDYEWSPEADQNPSPNPDPNENMNCINRNVSPAPDPSPDPDPPDGALDNKQRGEDLIPDIIKAEKFYITDLSNSNSDSFRLEVGLKRLNPTTKSYKASQSWNSAFTINKRQ